MGRTKDPQNPLMRILYLLILPYMDFLLDLSLPVCDSHMLLLTLLRDQGRKQYEGKIITSLRAVRDAVRQALLEETAMAQEKMVTVLLLFYGDVEGLARSMESVKKQRYPYVEIFVAECMGTCPYIEGRRQVSRGCAA